MDGIEEADRAGEGEQVAGCVAVGCFDYLMGRLGDDVFGQRIPYLGDDLLQGAAAPAVEGTCRSGDAVVAGCLGDQLQPGEGACAYGDGAQRSARALRAGLGGRCR